jgi:hypothetical protein
MIVKLVRALIKKALAKLSAAGSSQAPNSFNQMPMNKAEIRGHFSMEESSSFIILLFFNCVEIFGVRMRLI